MGDAVEKEGYEEWERESDVGKLGGGPVGKETDTPVGALDVCVDRWYEIVAPGWSGGIGGGRGKAEDAVGVELVYK